MIEALGVVRARVTDELGIEPESEGARRFVLYGGIELSFLEYRLPSGPKLCFAFEGEDTLWPILYLDGGQVFACELDSPSPADEVVMLLRVAMERGIDVRKSMFKACRGARIRADGVRWYLEPLTGEMSE